MGKTYGSINKGARRPISKTITSIRTDISNSLIYYKIQISGAAPGPYTMVGLRWDLTFSFRNPADDSAVTTGGYDVPNEIWWAIIHWRKPAANLGELEFWPNKSTSLPTGISERDLYWPAKDVLAFGYAEDISHYDGGVVAKAVKSTDKDECKTKRKFARGDSLWLVCYAAQIVSNRTAKVRGLVQYFAQE